MREDDNDGNIQNISKIGLILGPIIFIIFVFIQIESLSYEAKVVLGLTFWMSIWWITEAVPIYVAALLPLVLFPIFNILSLSDLSSSYADSIIFLFFGGFILAKAIENVNLHQRFALNILKIFGTNPRYIIGAFMIVTAFLSGWISNTATAMLMLPIATAVIVQIRAEEQNRFGTFLLLSIAYSASIGGMATLIGTPPNAIFASLSESLLNVDISFGKWMLIGFPTSIITLAAAWIYMIKIGKISSKSITDEKNIILEKLSQLGRMTRNEKVVAAIFISTALAWITRGLLWKDLFPLVDDSTIALISAISFFIIPSSSSSSSPSPLSKESINSKIDVKSIQDSNYKNKEKREKKDKFATRLLDWKTAVTIPWGILLLIGGGLALAQGFTATGLDVYIANSLSFLNGMHYLFIIIVILAVTVFAGEVISNTATAALLLPIAASLATTLSVNPLLLMAPIAVATSIGFIMPVATPPNAIVFSSKYITTIKMARAGIPLDIIGIVIVTMLTSVLVPLVLS